MPIFARRRLHSMLKELAVHMESVKVKELTRRLELNDTKSALAAEAELSMLWAISRAAHIEVEPRLRKSNHRPDAYSSNLFSSGGSVVEVKALSDDSFSGREAMNRTANIISGYADQILKRAGRHLYFEFNQISYWAEGRYHRERCVTPDFQLTPDIQNVLRLWISAPDWPNPGSIRITKGKTDVVIKWCETTSPHFRVFCSMPPVAYDLENNPIYKALKGKARKQLRHVGPKILRCVFLFDAGCDLLRRLRPMTQLNEVGGEDIINHAIDKLSIDVVCVFSPDRQRSISLISESTLLWKVTCFDKRFGLDENEYSRLNEVAAQLPRPRYEGYQARDLHRQDVFNPQSSGQYLGFHITTEHHGGKMTIKISSRLVQEYLAGRLSETQFQRFAFGNELNFFDSELKRGNTIQAVEFESGGLDEDDDYLVFELEPDWGARPLRDSDAEEPLAKWKIRTVIRRIQSRLFRIFHRI